MWFFVVIIINLVASKHQHYGVKPLKLLFNIQNFLKVIMIFEWNCGVSFVKIHFPLSSVCVFVSQKKRMGNYLTLLKRVYCVQYNLSHPPLKLSEVVMCLYVRTLFPFPYACVFVSKKNKTFKNFKHAQIALYSGCYC